MFMNIVYYWWYFGINITTVSSRQQAHAITGETTEVAKDFGSRVRSAEYYKRTVLMGETGNTTKSCIP